MFNDNLEMSIVMHSDSNPMSITISRRKIKYELCDCKCVPGETVYNVSMDTAKYIDLIAYFAVNIIAAIRPPFHVD